MTSTPSTFTPPAAAGDFATEIIERRRRRHVPKLTIALAIFLIAALAFVVGVEVQKQFGSTSTSGAGAGALGAFRGGQLPAGFTPPTGTGGASSAGGGAFGNTSGTVTLIKGSTLYVTDVSGNTVLVKTTAATQVTKSVSATTKAIRPGDSVSFAGTQAKSGAYQARSITVTSAHG